MEPGGGLGQRIVAAAQRAQADGRSIHHVTMCPADWAPLRLPAVTLKPGPDATYSVLWAMDAKGFKLVPYRLESA